MKPAVFVFLAASMFAQDKTDALARILAANGTINPAELAQVEGTASADRLLVLAGILPQKGVLSPSDMAQLHLPPRSVNTMASAATPPAPPQGPPRGREHDRASTIQRRRGSACDLGKPFPGDAYGTVLMNSVYNTAPMNITDIPLFITKPATPGDDKAFAMTARQTRLGLKFESRTKIVGAKLSGQVEVDFLAA